MPPTTPLPLIVAHARAGALAQAWRLFREAGLEGVGDDAAVLAVKGRLLKEDALGAVGATRAAILAQAAAAYGAAAALSASSYHLINAASLSLLAGDPGAARAAAEQVLGGLDQRPEEAETPYWRLATRAEALLLVGQGAAAAGALTEGIGLAPRAWEDHASTLRQLGLICDAQGVDATWLEPLRPPRSLHFAGHMSLSADAVDLRDRVAEFVAAEGIGFGFGALAAGADILVAEALIDAGAELNLILPGPPDVFRKASVARQGDPWGARFDALLAAAASVRTSGVGQSPPDVLAIQLASEVAMGQAVLRARSLQTEALQLVILDLDERGGEPGGSTWARGAWAASGRRQIVIQAPRVGTAASPAPPPRTGERLLALLAVDVAADDIPKLAGALANAPAPALAPSWGGRAFLLAYADPAQAAQAADLVRDALPLTARIAGVYDVSRTAGFPGMAGPIPFGPAVTLATLLLDSTPPGAAHVTGGFASALAAAASDRRMELVGALDISDGAEPQDIFALGR